WLAMADMLESSAKSAKAPGLEAKVKKLEEDLSLGDDDLGKNKGILSRIKWEIRQNSSLWSGENPYAVGLVYEKYIKTYEQVAAIRNDILNLWHKAFGASYSAAQSKPMKILLIGGKLGAPQLTGEPGPDLALAEKTREIYRQRGDKIRADLASALGRPVDETRDGKHLAVLGQLGFEWEHLLDDCPDRLSHQGSDTVQAAVRDRYERYMAYLDKLAEGRPRLAIEGPAQVESGKAVALKVRVTNLDASILKTAKFVWREAALRGKLEAKGDSARFSSASPGSYKIWVELQQPGKAVTVKLAEAFHELEVTDPAKIGLSIVGPSRGEVGKPLTLTAEITAPAELRSTLRLAWNSGGRNLGSASSTTFGSSQPGSYRITLAAYQKGPDGKEIQVATAEHSVTLSRPAGDEKKVTETPPSDTPASGTSTPPAPKFSATVPANWEMQPIKDGVKFVRKEAKTKGPCGWDSSVSGSVTATFKAGAMDDKALQARIAETQAGLEKQKAERKIGCATPDMAVGLFKAGGPGWRGQPCAG
ncbi:MAG: hypothetical protein ACK4TK_04605, partial [Thiobacillaceae bacterium]